ncbi:MAG: HAD-IA family hydrolase [Candidatus Dependentiae bacterium]|nr:HAD-IA family hydrolase [Candidatus Dependentiae bacterium]
MNPKKFFKPLLLLIAVSVLILGAPQPLKTNPNPNNDIHVIFDMNGVLVKNSGETKILGIGKFIAYALMHPFSIKKTIRKKLYEFLNTLEARDPQETNACDEEGTQLPQIMCTWMKGTKTPAAILEDVETEVAQRWGGLELNIVSSISRMMFTPELMAQTQEWVPETLDFVDELKEQGYKVHILSNFDTHTFNVMRKQHPEVFEKFDSITVSGDIGLIKPDPTIYEHVLTTNGIDRSKSFFIDDCLVNVQAAEQQGICSSLCTKKGKNPHIKAVRDDFYDWIDHMTNHVGAVA